MSPLASCPVSISRTARRAALASDSGSGARDGLGSFCLDRVPGGLGVVAAPGRGGPPERPVGKLVHLPLGVLLEPVVMTALRARVAQAGPAARLIGGVVLEVGLGGGPPADGASAGRVPDLGQVPELDSGVMAAGFVSVVAGIGGDRVDGDDQVRAVSRGGQPPGAITAGGAIPAGRGESEPALARRWPRPGACAPALGLGPGAA